MRAGTSDVSSAEPQSAGELVLEK